MGASFDEEYIDPHGECAHEIWRLQALNRRLLIAAEALIEKIANVNGIDVERAALIAACVKAHGVAK